MGERRAYGARGGMSLVEILVAMSILLIGIWAVANAFPKLFRVLSTQEHRTQMSKLANQALLRVLEDGVPYWIHAAAAGIPPDSLPDDPVDPTTLPNARDDYVHVEWERFTVPAPQFGPVSGANPPPAIHALAQGPCDRVAGGPGAPPAVWVFQLVPLSALAEDPGGTPPSRCFYLTASGLIRINTSYAGRVIDKILISYCWLDTALNARYTNWELVDATAPFEGTASWQVSAAGRSDVHRTGGVVDGIVQDSATAWGLVSYAASWDPGGALLAPPVAAPGLSPVVWVERMFGTYLKFNPADAGKEMLVCYDLRRDREDDGEPVRRSILMIEDRMITDAETVNISGGMGDVIIQLGCRGISNEINVLGDKSSPAPQADGNGDISGVHVVAVNLGTGDVFYNDGVNLSLTDPSDPKFGYPNGKVRMRLPLDITAGQTFRFFYRSVDNNTVQVQRAPAMFLEEAALALYPPFWRDRFWGAQYRQWTDGAYTRLAFQPAVAGQTISVDYYVDAARPRLISGELHTIPAESQVVTLDRPGVVAVRAVRGASIRARGSWMSPSGALRTVDVNSLLAQ